MTREYVEYRPNKVLDYMFKTGKNTREDLGSFLGYSPSVALFIINDLCRAGLLVEGGFVVRKRGSAEYGAMSFCVTPYGKEKMTEEFGIIRFVVDELAPEAEDFLRISMNRYLEHPTETTSEISERIKEAYTAEEFQRIEDELKRFFP